MFTGCVQNVHVRLSLLGYPVSIDRSYFQHHPHVYENPLQIIFCSVLLSVVSGGGLVLGTQTPLESRSYPTGHLVVGGGISSGTQRPDGLRWNPTGHALRDPSALFKPKGSVVVNTVVNIVAANIATIAILFWFITLSIICFYFWIRKAM